MKFKNSPAAFLAILLLCLLVVPCAHSISLPDRPSAYVIDLAGIVDNSTENRLNSYLKELEQKTTAQFIILTIKSLEGESIEDFAIKIAHDKWKLGQRGKDNGLLLLIAVNDHKYRIEVGYGLEGVLPDSMVGEIGRSLMVPFFKKSDYSSGIFSAALVMANTIAADAGVKIAGMPTMKRRVEPLKQNQPRSLLHTVITTVFLLILLVMFIKHPRLFFLLFLFSSMGRGGAWGGGGGFGRGGFGSFGGGGGGGFGGGGASGGW
ncbi:MAG: TPM domain-containing protein [Pseudomonadota bacterium]|uniref:TPM domain-containing protein n=1 Tax=Candidatus Desulfatibia profunda TaxID=2841695 RepID=A0A8J6NMV7_9BACT|nr:TPM domain-containing protein [Candidatus Desulfatibia profunda]MBL7179173.1 TPM domain-containing protein [Desulfobacterales bacterium]